MADENDNQVADEGQTDDLETQTAPDEKSTDEPGVSSTSNDNSGVDRATDARLARLEERNQYLENTQRILEQFGQQQQPPQQVPQQDRLPDEVEALDKLLEPAVNRRFKQGIEPIIGTLTELKEENDASKFENFLNRSESELFDPENEQKLNAVYQQVDNFRRQVAQQRGQWLSRQDAYLYLSGVEAAKAKIAGRKQKVSQAVVEERKRVGNVRAIGNLNTNIPHKQDAGVEGLVKKMRANQRMTAAELEQLRNSDLGDVQF